jgi:hypothetical protein
MVNSYIKTILLIFIGFLSQNCVVKNNFGYPRLPKLDCESCDIKNNLITNNYKLRKTIEIEKNYYKYVKKDLDSKRLIIFGKECKVGYFSLEDFADFQSLSFKKSYQGCYNITNDIIELNFYGHLNSYRVIKKIAMVHKDTLYVTNKMNIKAKEFKEFIFDKRRPDFLEFEIYTKELNLKIMDKPDW